MRAFNTIGAFLAAGSCAFALACGSTEGTQGSNAGATPPPAVANAHEAVTLHTLTVEAGHEVNFIESASGFAVINESGLPSQASVAGKLANARTFEEAFRALSPGERIPTTLLEADKRVAARAPRVASEVAPPSDESAAKIIPHVETTADQTWFKNTMCNPATPGGGSQWFGQVTITSCNVANGNYTGPWVKTGQYHSQNMLGSEAAGHATITTYWYNNGNPIVEVQRPLYPGTWNWQWTAWTPQYGTMEWFRTTITGLATGATVAQATEACGEGNEVACYKNCVDCDPYTSSYCQIDGVTNGWCGGAFGGPTVIY